MKTTLLSLLLVLLSQTVLAQVVVKVKGNQALIELPAPNVGDEYYTINSGGKKTALLQIKKAKGNKAVADVVKGKAEQGMRLVPVRATAAKAKRRTRPGSDGPRSEWSGGLLGGMNMDTMTFTASDGVISQALTLTGSSLVVKGFVQYEMSPEFALRGSAGMDGFNVAANSASGAEASCTNNTNCTMGFQYLALDGAGLWYLIDNSSFRGWLGAGYSFFFAMSGTTNITNFDATIKTNNAVFVGAGADFNLSHTMYIPVSAEYRYYMSSTAEIAASAISLRLGLGWRF